MILESDRIQTRALTWRQLSCETGLDVSGQIIKRVIGTMDYYKLLLAGKDRFSERLKKGRKGFAEIILERHPDPED